MAPDPKDTTSAPKGGGFQSWLKKGNNKYLLGGGGLVLAYALYQRSKSGSSSSSTTAIAGQACVDANGNASVTDANGNCILAAGGAAPVSPIQGPAGATGAAGAPGAAVDAGTIRYLETGLKTTQGEIKNLQDLQQSDSRAIKALQVSDAGEKKSAAAQGDGTLPPTVPRTIPHTAGASQAASTAPTVTAALAEAIPAKTANGFAYMEPNGQHAVATGTHPAPVQHKGTARDAHPAPARHKGSAG